MKQTVAILITVISIMSSCTTTKDTVKMTVASEKRTAMGVAPIEVLQVKEGDKTNWSFFYSKIEGFNYEPGYEYVLEVKKEKLPNPLPADASAIKYTLIKEISKTKKTSQNMLSDIPNAAKYVWTGKVLGIEEANVGVGAAAGKFPVKIVKIEVTALNGTNLPFKDKAIIHAELVKSPKISPELGKEYIFKAKNAHPAHALGVYMLDTDVQDLTR